MTINDVKEFIERKLIHAKECYSADMVMNCRAQAFGVIMFAQKFIPYEELERYWEGNRIREKFDDIAREKSR